MSVLGAHRERGGGEKGRVIIFTGPMYAGKTTRLLKGVLRSRADGKNVVLVKHKQDIRTSKERVVTHDESLNVPADIIVGHLAEV